MAVKKCLYTACFTLLFCLCLQILGRGFGAAFAVDGSRHNAAGIARTLATGKQARQSGALQRGGIAHDADGCRSARFYAEQ